MVGTHRLRTIDADQSHPGAAAQQQRIANDDPFEAVHSFG
jgi:hypothetical protein